MNILPLTKQMEIAFYGHTLPCDSSVGIAGVIGGKVCAVAIVCRWEGKSTICFTDFEPGFSKKNLVIFGKAIIEFLDTFEEPVLAVCDDSKARAFTEKAGFALLTTTGGSFIMVKEPRGLFNFRGMANQLVPGESFSNEEIIDLIGYGIDTQLVSNLGVLEESTTRYLCDGMFVKQALVPAGTLMVSKVHRRDCVCSVAYGDVSIMDQTSTTRIKAPCTFLSKAGIKRVGYFHKDTLWTNIHNSHGLTDLAEIEAGLAYHADRAWIHALLERNVKCAA